MFELVVIIIFLALAVATAAFQASDDPPLPELTQSLAVEDESLEVDIDWVDREVDALLDKTVLEAPHGERFWLDPTAPLEKAGGRSIHELVSHRDSADIARACSAILAHARLEDQPLVSVFFFDGDELDVDFDVGGNAPNTPARIAHIEIKPQPNQQLYEVHVNRNAVQSPNILAAVLAHELSHIIEKRLGLGDPGSLRAELRVDMLAFLFGFGRLWLRGGLHKSAPEQLDDGRHIVREYRFGYLDYRLAAYLQALLERTHGHRIPLDDLPDDVARWLKKSRRFLRSRRQPTLAFPFHIEPCDHCGQRLRYPNRASVTAVTCPSCATRTTR